MSTETPWSDENKDRALVEEYEHAAGMKMQTARADRESGYCRSSGKTGTGNETREILNQPAAKTAGSARNETRAHQWQ
jgi:hypothetical protein